MTTRSQFVLLAFAFLFIGNLTLTNSYERPPKRATLFIPRPENAGPTTPEQVHISTVGPDKMRVSWVTEGDVTPTVKYGTSSGNYQSSATGTTSSYKYLWYKSGKIHDVVIGPLNPDTTYYYVCGDDTTKEFSFKTTPSQLPIKFAIIGDLGQTEWTNSTLEHISASNYDMLLLPGDLSYADFMQTGWDSFGRLVEPLASSRPWMVTQGNHEIEKIPVVHGEPFTAYNARWHMPFEESGSETNLYYSFDVVGVHVIMLGSYTDFDPSSAQFKWLQGDLAKIDRSKTPWVIVLLHAPWYNTNKAHRNEEESDEMRKHMEEMLFTARVDAVFAGHVHSYERFDRVYLHSKNNCGPIYITIGDGGNREGLADKYDEPQIPISIFREASFGHGQLQVMNATHALWTWHRNQDDVAVAADSIWLTNLSTDPACKV